MAAVLSKWTRYIACGCNHSIYACPNAQDAVMGMVERWKPEVRICLGDVHDWTAFRTGAKGTKDEGADVAADEGAGIDWLKRYRPTHRVLGNHDWRINMRLNDRNAIVVRAAGAVIESLRKVDEQNGTIVRPYDMDDGWFTFGDTKFGHGWMYNEMAIRDHAETFGRCVIAQLHRPGEMPGRRTDRPVAWCVGTLGDPKKFEYAATHKQRLTWAHGFVWGEFNHKRCIVRLERQQCGHGRVEEWRLPV